MASTLRKFEAPRVIENGGRRREGCCEINMFDETRVAPLSLGWDFGLNVESSDDGPPHPAGHPLHHAHHHHHLNADQVAPEFRQTAEHHNVGTVQVDVVPEVLRHDLRLVAICTSVIIFYFAIGIVFFIVAEDWTFIDALYFCTTTLTTVGYGDVLPKTDFAKIFCCFYVVIGIGIIGSALGIVGGYIMDKQEEYAQSLLEDAGLDDGDDTNDCIPARGPMGEVLDSFFTLLFCVGFGMLFYHFADDEMSLVDAMYMSFITITTVGFGDYSPKTPLGRVVACVWILCSVLAVSRALGSIVDVFLNQRRERLEQELLAKQISMDELLEGAGEDGKLDLNEFSLLKLRTLGRITQEDLDMCAAVFQDMDTDSSGSIDVHDLREANHRASLSAAGSDNSPKKGPPKKLLITKKQSELHNMRASTAGISGGANRSAQQ